MLLLSLPIYTESYPPPQSYGLPVDHEELWPVIDFALLSDPRRVDDAVLLSLPYQQCVYCIPCGARYVAHNTAILSV